MEMDPLIDIPEEIQFSKSNVCLICSTFITSRSNPNQSTIDLYSNVMYKLVTFPSIISNNNIQLNDQPLEEDNKNWSTFIQTKDYTINLFKLHFNYCKRCLDKIRKIHLTLKKIEQLQQQVIEFQQEIFDRLNELQQVNQYEQLSDLVLNQFRDEIHRELTMRLGYNDVLIPGPHLLHVDKKESSEVDPTQSFADPDPTMAYVRLVKLEDLDLSSEQTQDDVGILHTNVTSDNDTFSEVVIPDSYVKTRAGPNIRRKLGDNEKSGKPTKGKGRGKGKYQEEPINLHCGFPNCKFSGIGRFKLSSHVDEVHANCKVPDDASTILCFECGVLVSNVEELNLHSQSTHQPDKYPHACKYCPRRYLNSRSLWTHKLQNHKELFYKERTERCIESGNENLDSLKARTLSAIILHKAEKTIATSSDPIITKTSEKIDYDLEKSDIIVKDLELNSTSQTDTSLKLKGRTLAVPRKTPTKNTSRITPKIFPCPFCDKVYNVASSLSSHKLLHSNKTYPCPDCPKVYNNPVSFSSHKLKFHTPNRIIIKRKPKGKKPTNSKTFPCPLCDKIYKFASSLTSHKRQHHSNKTYKCPDCPKVYNNPVSFYAHKSKHQPTKSTNRIIIKRNRKRKKTTLDLETECFICEQCGRSFKERQLLTSHLYRHRKPFICTHCNTDPQPSYSNQNELHYHQIKHHPELNLKGYECPHCSKVLCRADSLKLHIRNIHNLERNFACEVPGCNFKTIHEKNLKVHTLVHNNQRNYKCDQCDAAFFVPYTLKTHVMAKHTGEKPYVCKICNKAFLQKRKLKLHELALHGSERPFVCELCGLRFPTKNHVHGHLRSHHLGKGVGAGIKPLRKSKYNITTSESEVTPME